MSDFLLGVVLRGAGRSPPGRAAPQPGVMAGFPVGEPAVQEEASDIIRPARDSGSPPDGVHEQRAMVRGEAGSDMVHIHASTPDPAPFPDAVPGSSVRPVAEPAGRALPETVASARVPGRAPQPEAVAEGAPAPAEIAPVPSPREDPPIRTEPAPREPAHDPAPSPAPPPASPSPAVEPRTTEPARLVETRAPQAPAGRGRIEVRIGRLELGPESSPSTGSPGHTPREAGGPPGLTLARRYLDRVWR